ncbi:MAG: S41 family peptidase [Patescibacteria group bacterium]
MENSSDQKKSSNLKIFVITAVIFFSAGTFIGFGNRPEVSKVYGLENKENPLEEKIDFSHFWKVWNLIEEKYVMPNPKLETKPATPQDKVYGAIKGLVDSLKDPNSVFFLPPEAEIFENEISGNFEGVGMEVGIRDEVLIVISPLKGTPAELAGVKAEDKIFQIDEQLTAGMSVDEAVSLIRGKQGTSVTLTLIREGVEDPIKIKITRGSIAIPTIDSKWIEDTFVISLYNFSANATDLFRGEIRKFIEQKKKNSKLILDLRGNPGGFLEASVEIASWFLPAGKVIVTEDFAGKREEIIHRSKGYDAFPKNLKMAILINGGSASASEIVAGALQDHKIAKLVGSQSFGKGSVQELIQVSSDTSVKITVARWLTPLGHSISVEGLTPDYKVEVKEEDIKEEKDIVLEKALEVLK